jgi:hypothetical protein
MYKIFFKENLNDLTKWRFVKLHYRLGWFMVNTQVNFYWTYQQWTEEFEMKNTTPVEFIAPQTLKPDMTSAFWTWPWRECIQFSANATNQDYILQSEFFESHVNSDCQTVPSNTSVLVPSCYVFGENHKNIIWWGLKARGSRERERVMTSLWI